MKFKTSLRFIFMAMMAIAMIVGCKTSAPQEISYNQYVSSFTSGLVSNQSKIRIQLSQPVSGIEAGSKADKKLIGVSPSLEGEWHWVDAQTLLFTSKKELVSNTMYNVTLKLGKLFDGEDDFKFHFTTMTQAFRVEPGVMENSSDDLRENVYGFSLTTADFMVDEDVEKLVVATQEGNKLNIIWEHNGIEKRHTLWVQKVVRSKKESSLTLQYSKSVSNASGHSSEEFEVPSIDNFKVVGITTVHSPDQYLQITFSDPLKARQDLSGLVTIADTDVELRYLTEKNRIKIYPSMALNGVRHITIHEGILNILGKSFAPQSSYDVSFESPNPQVEFIGKGNIMPSSTGMSLPFKAVSLKSVEVRVIKIFENNIPMFLQTSNMDGTDSYNIKRAGRLIAKKTIFLNEDPTLDLSKWNTFTLQLNELISPDPGAIYQVSLNFRKRNASYPCLDDSDSAEVVEDIIDDITDLKNEQKAYDTPEYYGSWYDDWENYDWYQRDNPCHSSYYVNRETKTNILSSDLGIIVKGNNNQTLNVYVNDIISTTPLSGVKLEVLSYQNQLIGEGSSDKDGMAAITAQGVPYLLIAKKDKQRGYLRIDDGSSLSLSRFDVSGQTLQQGMKGFIYGERGVWRPGDSIFVSFILQNRGDALPDHHPVQFELINPQGHIDQKQVQSLGGRSVITFKTATSSDAITGTYTGRVTVGAARFDKSLRVETIKPNRLKLALDIPGERLSYGTGIPITLSAKWLHGAIARNLNANVSVTLTKWKTSFKGFDDFVFDDPVRSFSADETVVFDGKLNDAGQVAFQPRISVREAAPGMLRVSFYTRVFEEGGNFSLDRFSVPYSPYPVYIGVRTPKGDKRGMLITGENHTVEVVSVNADGKPVDVSGLSYEVLKVDWRWWWESDDDNLASYTGREGRSRIQSGTLNTKNGKASFDFKIDYPNWGRYLIRIIDNKNGHACGKAVYVDWPGWALKPTDDPQSAQMLMFSLDKERYNIGEKATVTFPSASGGRALVSIENGHAVLSSHWVETKDQSTSFTFKVDENMTPNVYVNITLLQPHGQTQNSLPIRMYGVMPMLVENPETHLNPVIDMASELQPEQKALIKVSEKGKKPMSYTLAIVDEGLLDITRFATPQPWNYFFAREALGVKTWDLYGYVMGAYGGRIERAFAIGGDIELDGKKSDGKQNRFKPVVRFMGPFKLDGGKVAKHEITMPRYVGSVRVMVVASSATAYGSAEKAVPVRSPLMLLTTLPRVCSPEETLSMPVTLFSMIDKDQSVTVAVSEHGGFEIDGNKSHTITLSPNSDKVVYFKLKAGSTPAHGKIKVTAQSGSHQASEETHMEIRSSNPEETRAVSALLKAGETTTLRPVEMGGDASAKSVLEASVIPPLNLGQRMRYLLTYPHGCAEQTTSAAFPQLYLSELLEDPKVVSATVAGNITTAIKRLSSMQLPDGGIAYWPGLSRADEWTTSYVGYFMSEASQKGYVLPDGFVKRWTKFQKQTAQQWQHDGAFPGRDDLQAFRLFSLSQIGSADLSAMNRMKKISTLSNTSRWYLAAAYARAGYVDVGRQLIENLATTNSTPSSWSYSYGSDARDEAMILETYNLLKMNDKAFAFVQKLSNRLSSSEWLSTQSTAYSLLAISHYLSSNKISKEFSFEMTVNGKKSQLSSQKAVLQSSVTPATGDVTIKNKGNGSLFVRLITTGSPSSGLEESFKSNLEMSIDYLDMNGNAVDIQTLSTGQDLMSVITVKNPGTMGHINNIALTQMVPSGFEIRNTRLEAATAYGNKGVDYQDFRDDRVMSYFSLASGGTQRIVTLLHVSYAGRFYLPALHCQAMYDNRVAAQLKGQWIEVEHQK